jgi:hypothetical protein
MLGVRSNGGRSGKLADSGAAGTFLARIPLKVIFAW